MNKNKAFIAALISLSFLTSCANTSNVPYIGENGNWWVNGSDTGVRAEGKDGSDGSNGQNGSQGEKGDNGISVVSVTYKETKDGKDYFTITLSDGSTFEFWTTRGEDGSNGNDGVSPIIAIGEDGYWYINGTKTDVCAKGQDGNITEIESIELTDSNGLVDTYTITYSNDGVTSMTFAFSVTNGSSILNGDGAPDNELGNDGDSYLDTSTGDYYVKSNGAWSFISNISSGVPYVGEDGYWYIKDGFTGESKSTGILADGYKEEEYLNRTPSSGLRYVTASEGGVSGYLVSSYTGNDSDVVIPNYIGMTKVIGVDNNAFSGNTSIASVSFSKNTNFIGDKAFYGCTGLTSIDFNDATIITIGSHAFYNCSALTTELDFGEKLKTIGSSAFCNCSSVTSINLPSSLESVETYAFYNNSGVTQLTIADGIKKLGDFCFAGMQKITEVVVPSSVISIGESVFNDCGGLTEITLPFIGSSREINFGSSNSTFYASNRNFGYIFGTNSFTNNCRQTRQYYASYNYSSSTEQYTVRDYRSSYKNYYFPTGLTSVTITDDEVIDPDSFDGINFIEEINIKNDIDSIEPYSFYGCTNLERIDFNGIVKNIFSYAFYNNVSLESVDVSENIETIGSYAFYGCTNLKDVLNLKHAKTIGSYAFYNTSCLNEYNLNSASAVGSYAFYNSSATQITIKSDTLTSIGSYAFSNNTSLTSIMIDCPNLENIGEGAFQGCSSLTTVFIKDCNATLGENAFYGDSSLVSVNLGTGISSIGSSAFYNCSSLTGIVVPSTVESIGQNAFRGCTSLATMTLPFAGASANDNYGLGFLFGGNGYYGNNNSYVPSSLTKLTLTKAVNSYGLYGCTNITTVILSDDITSIGSYFAYNCSGLIKLDIGNSVKIISDHSFDSCSSLTKVEFGSGLEQIGINAFRSCNSLTSVSFKTLDGWYLSTSSSGTLEKELDSNILEDKATIATYLRYTYTNYYWHRKQETN